MLGLTGTIVLSILGLTSPTQGPQRVHYLGDPSRENAPFTITLKEGWHPLKSGRSVHGILTVSDWRFVDSRRDTFGLFFQMHAKKYQHDLNAATASPIRRTRNAPGLRVRKLRMGEYSGALWTVQAQYTPVQKHNFYMIGGGVPLQGLVVTGWFRHKPSGLEMDLLKEMIQSARTPL